MANLYYTTKNLGYEYKPWAIVVHEDNKPALYALDLKRAIRRFSTEAGAKAAIWKMQSGRRFSAKPRGKP